MFLPNNRSTVGSCRGSRLVLTWTNGACPPTYLHLHHLSYRPGLPRACRAAFPLPFHLSHTNTKTLHTDKHQQEHLPTHEHTTHIHTVSLPSSFQSFLWILVHKKHTASCKHLNRLIQSKIKVIKVRTLTQQMLVQIIKCPPPLLNQYNAASLQQNIIWPPPRPQPAADGRWTFTLCCFQPACPFLWRDGVKSASDNWAIFQQNRLGCYSASAKG